MLGGADFQGAVARHGGRQLSSKVGRDKLSRCKELCAAQGSDGVPDAKIQLTTGTTFRVTALIFSLCPGFTRRGRFSTKGGVFCRNEGTRPLDVMGSAFLACLSRRPFLCTREGCDQLGSYRVTGDVLRCKGYVTSTAGRVARAGDVAVTAGHGRGRDVACCVAAAT